MSKSIQHLQDININDEWETRASDLRNAILKYKVNPVIDIFATRENKKCFQYYSKENSAFNHELRETCFANPMYSKIDECMKFLYYQHLSFNTEMLILTYSKTDTKWWHSYVEDRAEIHFIKGRLKFELDGIIPRYCSKVCKEVFIEEIDFCPKCNSRLTKNSAPYPSCWIIYRKKKL